MSAPLQPSPPIQLLPHDREVLRPLAEQVAAIAALPVHREKARLWGRMNDRRSVRPMVWITEVPWHEFSDDTPELILRCRAPWARNVELEMRRQLYQWRHLPVDMIFSDYVPCPIAYRSTGFGILRQGELLAITGGAGISSQHFEPQISSLADLHKIKDPVVTVDRADTAARLAAMTGAFGDILPARELGCNNLWFTPWDNLVMWYGVQEALMDLIEQPEVINAAIARIVECCLEELDQMVALNLLAVNNNNCRIGSAPTATRTSCRAPASIPPIRRRNTSGVARTRRSSPRSRRRCTGSLPCGTTCPGSRAGALSTTAAARCSTPRWRSCGASRTCAKSP